MIGVTRCEWILRLAPWSSLLFAIPNSAAQGQMFQKRLLPDPVLVHGLVVDELGNPLPDAYVHVNDKALEVAQDGFSVDTDQPRIVIRKVGYESAVLEISAPEDVRVTLHPTGKLPPRRCSDGDAIYESTFSLPRYSFGIPKNRTTSEGARFGEDYSVDLYRPQGGPDSAVIEYGFGPTWSFGWPPDFYVWASVDYREDIWFEDGPVWVIDARGTLPDGTHWRSLNMVGQTVSYSNQDKASAALLDAVLDRTCVIVREPKNP